MQVFKLVKDGFVDRVIAFDELPEKMLTNITKGPINGYPRDWYEFMGVKKTEKDVTPFYVLNYLSRNQDREKWSEISSFVKRSVDPSIRLMEKIESMAAPVAADSHSDLTLDPEDVPIIPIPKSTPTEGSEEKPRRRSKVKIDEAVAA